MLGNYNTRINLEQRKEKKMSHLSELTHATTETKMQLVLSIQGIEDVFSPGFWPPRKNPGGKIG